MSEQLSLRTNPEARKARFDEIYAAAEKDTKGKQVFKEFCKELGVKSKIKHCEFFAMTGVMAAMQEESDAIQYQMALAEAKQAELDRAAGNVIQLARR
ncbi:MAG TPA: hypothetical protein V6C86_24190 [Oculatellaceae cyanobacterium]